MRKENALELAERLMTIPQYDLPLGARLYLQYVFGKYGESYESAYLALCHYAQMAGAKCQDKVYKLTPEAKAWEKSHLKSHLNKSTLDLYPKYPQEKTIKGNRIQLPLFQEDLNV